MKKLFSTNYLFIATTIFIGVCYIIFQYNFTLIGDDLTFTQRWFELQEERGWLSYPTFFYRHWLWSNARLADKINPLFFGILPKWIFYIANSLMIMSLFWLTARLSRLKSTDILYKMILLTLMVFTLPWWDSMMLNVCWLNYVWSAVLCLCVIKLFSKSNTSETLGKWKIAGLFLFSAFSAGMHEASGVATCSGLIVYSLVRHKRKKLTYRQKTILISVLIGTLYVISSPASWNRLLAVEEIANKRGLFEIFTTSAFFLIPLLAIIVILTIKRSGRKTLNELIHSEWLIFTVAAIVSGLIGMASGIIGRTCFFSQICSLIAIFHYISRYHTTSFISKILSLILVSAIAIHFIAVTHYQKIIGTELKTSIEKFKESADGIIYMDFLREQEMPCWLLNKVKGVPDTDDVWHLHTISLYYSDSSKPLIILPEKLQNIDASEIKNTIRLGYDYVSPQQPETTTLMTYEKIPLQHFFGNMIETQNGIITEYSPTGKEYIVTPFEKDNKQLYLISERYIDWGD